MLDVQLVIRSYSAMLVAVVNAVCDLILLIMLDRICLWNLCHLAFHFIIKQFKLDLFRWDAVHLSHWAVYLTETVLGCFLPLLYQ